MRGASPGGGPWTLVSRVSVSSVLWAMCALAHWVPVPGARRPKRPLWTVDPKRQQESRERPAGDRRGPATTPASERGKKGYCRPLFFCLPFWVAFLGCPLLFFFLGSLLFTDRRDRGEKGAHAAATKGTCDDPRRNFFSGKKKKKKGQKAAGRCPPADITAHVERQIQDNVCASVRARTHVLGRHHIWACGLHRASLQAGGPRALPWLDQRACLAPP